MNQGMTIMVDGSSKAFFLHLDECLLVPLTEREKYLVKIFEPIQIEKHVPVSVSRNC